MKFKEKIKKLMDKTGVTFGKAMEKLQVERGASWTELQPKQLKAHKTKRKTRQQMAKKSRKRNR